MAVTAAIRIKDTEANKTGALRPT